MAQLAYSTDDPERLRVKVSKESIPNLCKPLTLAADRKEYVLKIGEIDTVTPTVIRALDTLKAHFVIVTTARSIKMSSTFVSNFDKLELNNHLPSRWIW